MNPYPQNSPKYEAWEEGYKEGIDKALKTFNELLDRARYQTKSTLTTE